MNEETNGDATPPNSALAGILGMLRDTMVFLGHKPSFARGGIFGAFAAVVMTASSVWAFVGWGDHPPGCCTILQKDALPADMYLHMPKQTRVLELHGTNEIRGTYRNEWNNNTGRIVGFRNGDVMTLTYIEDPDPHGQPRHGIGSIKFERVVADDSKGHQLWIGHEEGCDCSGQRTTVVGAILTTQEEAPEYAMRVIRRYEEKPVSFGTADDVRKEREAEKGSASSKAQPAG